MGVRRAWRRQANAADDGATLNATRFTAAAWRAGPGAPPQQPPPSPPPPSPPPPSPPPSKPPAGAPPRIVSLHGGGAGEEALFTMVVEDPDGGSDVRFAELQVAPTLGTGGTCWVRFDQRDQVFQLVNDGGNGLKGQVAAGGGEIANSQCAVVGAGSSAASAGSRLTATLRIRFMAAFVGPKKVYVKATDASNLVAAWVEAGRFDVTARSSPPPATPPPAPPPPADPANQAPQAGGVTPSSAVGSTVRLAAFFADPDGREDLRDVHVRIAPSLTSVQACWLRYDPAAGRLDVVNDEGAGWAVARANSRCAVEGWNAAWIGATLALQARITLTDAMEGELEVWTYALDAARADSGWQLRGMWTAPPRGNGPGAPWPTDGE